uniref:Uncharacterized protein n=1 Tax=Tanacetum cinerariifolium TaxID=118510 RepID=A0A6L2JJH9_TANCI|nr:hypothetical protein [Tanacetum cinerariifolium]
MASDPEQVRLNVLTKLQEALDEEVIMEEQVLTLMHRFADMFIDCSVEINNMIVLHDHLLIDNGKYARGCMTGADMKQCVYLKSVRDELAAKEHEKKATIDDELKIHVKALLLNTSLLTIIKYKFFPTGCVDIDHSESHNDSFIQEYDLRTKRYITPFGAMHAGSSLLTGGQKEISNSVILQISDVLWRCTVPDIGEWLRQTTPSTCV